MTGQRDPMMGFPPGIRFSPYLTLRNTTANPLSVTASLNYMAGAGPANLSLPLQPLKPFESRQVGMQSILATVGLENFNGSINLSFSFTGHAGDLVLATGSVDETGNYVFAVEPQGIGKSFSKVGPYWSVANGFDTMYSLWNPTAQAQDFVVTFYYGDGSGKYLLPVHLEAQASTMIDMMMLIGSQRPDANGNVIPASVQQGSAVFSSAKGEAEWMTLVVSGAVYNPKTATCGSLSCTTCDGFSDFRIDVGSSPGQLLAFCTYSNGTVYNETTSCSWSSDNTSVATVGNGSSAGLVSFGGNDTSTANISTTFPTMVVLTGQICSTGAAPSCPTAQVTPVAPIYVSRWVGTLTASDQFNCYYTQNCPNGTSPSCQPATFAFPIPAPSPCPKYGIENDLYTVVGGNKKCLGLGFKYASDTAKNCQ